MSSKDDYIVENIIGSGSFGKVYKITRKCDGKPLVWKEISYRNMTEKEKEMLCNEVNIIKDLRHPYIVRYYDRIVDRENKKIYIIMEYCSNGDLAAFIKSKKTSFIKEEVIWRILCQLCLALRECHCRKVKVLHRDIKPANIFMDENLNVKLGDFGLAKMLSEKSKYAHTNVGTPYYMSPEQTNELGYNEKSDIWSLGCVIYELCCLKPPFEAKNQLALAKKIQAGVYDTIPLANYSPELCKVIEQMLTVDPFKRPNIGDLMKNNQIGIRILEIQMRHKLYQIKRKDEELAKKEMELREKERFLEDWERKLKLKERRYLHTLTNKENIYTNFKIA